MLNRKGLAMGQLVIIILVIIAFLLIASTTYGFTKKAEKKAPGLLCRDTIGIKASTTINIGNVEGPLSTPICETQDVEIEGNREQIKQKLAELMAECWWMFHEGKFEEILNEPGAMRNLFNLKGDNMCFKCHNALINEEEIDGGPIGKEEMEAYLRETKHRKYKGITYLEYIQSYGGPGSAFVLDNIGPRESYSIVFLAKNKAAEDGEIGWFESASYFFGITYAPVVGPVGIVPALKAKKKFYDKDERDISVIVLDDLKAVNYAGCDSDLYSR